MKCIFTLLYALVLISSATSAADIQTPFRNETQSPIKNYNRATPTLVTSGTIGTGGVKEPAKKGFATVIDLHTEIVFE